MALRSEKIGGGQREENIMNEKRPYKEVTRNACNLCTPLGACMVFKGVEGAVPLLHGSQGCATYIRRYMISHFREPIDIASTSFSEDSAVFGGSANLKVSLDNIIRQYRPELIGVATTCLSETIGDDIPMILSQYMKEREGGETPSIVSVSTPSYRGTHAEGFHDAVRALVKNLSLKDYGSCQLAFFPGMVSPEDIRYVKRLVSHFGISATVLPDYSDTLDGQMWSDYQRIPKGGTPVEKIKACGSSRFALEFGSVIKQRDTAASYLEEVFGSRRITMRMPIGIDAMDAFIAALEEISGAECPEKYIGERGRLVDSYADAHKYLSGVRACLYGEEDLVASMAAFLAEIGITPHICASGGRSGSLRRELAAMLPEPMMESVTVMEDSDFKNIEEKAMELKPDILIGSSKGYKLARQMNIPLVRVGFPVHDRFGGQRIQHLGYQGTQSLLDRITNSIIEKRQADSPVGYAYM
jgi:nitrogenase molybdenum-iron protein NifN